MLPLTPVFHHFFVFKTCLQERLEAVRGAVAGQAHELEQGLQRRQGVAAARELLELLQDTAHIMSKVGHPAWC